MLALLILSCCISLIVCQPRADPKRPGMIACPGGTWGLMCRLTCKDQNCETCHRRTGVCSECKEGYIGTYCQLKCPDNCEGGCDRFTSQCMACKKGYYGPKCASLCSNECLGQNCAKEDGVCKQGCKEGFTGKDCRVLCNPLCKGPCNECKECKPGFYGNKCENMCFNGTCPQESEDTGTTNPFQRCDGAKCCQTCLTTVTKEYVRTTKGPAEYVAHDAAKHKYQVWEEASCGAWGTCKLCDLKYTTRTVLVSDLSWTMINPRWEYVKYPSYCRCPNVGV